MSYLNRQSVREESGFQDVQTEAMAGAVDGSNQTFAVSHRPFVDRNYDNEVTSSDFVVMFDGVPVLIDSFEKDLGTVITHTAPAEGVEVSIEYASSALPDSYIDELITEAEAIVNTSLKKFITVPLSPEDTDNYSTARRIALFYASGFALIRDYGKNTDDSESAKDGYAKLDQAKKMLADLMASIKDNGDSSNSGGDAQVVSEGHIFRNRGVDTRSHDFFMRKRC
jgi:hypothetical protein